MDGLFIAETLALIITSCAAGYFFGMWRGAQRAATVWETVYYHAAKGGEIKPPPPSGTQLRALTAAESSR